MPGLTYDDVGATRPAEDPWLSRPAGYRSFERTVALGAAPWETVSEAVMQWQVKRRSGFTVLPAARATEGAHYLLTAHIGPLRIREPVRVVAVVDRPDRRGFAYGTEHGHPVSGEEAFIAHRTPDGRVWLTLRSLTRPAQGAWGWAFPVLLLAQRAYRRRYLRALRQDPSPKSAP
ncbi:hypothetical protein Ade02nite_93910 [Paractinoplanes deccanensis]|uniref:DUF1990 domain-containing protein n=1 Tax=Paractinoplanes deccanensis TaxID=113561 RepID=A0ABQ3YL74_9ACTN|nr:DUF1990 domain-containing protein [Actinoplanes deccanensis]GID80750.1 hypothetical protein Ade02nite_93910 [Actinoplanes deccanensis]